LATPRTKEEALQQIRIVWCAFILTIPLYIYAGHVFGTISWLSFPNAGKLFIILAVLNLWSYGWTWRSRYSPARSTFQDEPEDIDAVRRWNGSWVVLISVAQCQSLFGFALQMGGKTLEQSLPFYAAGAILTLWLWPRKVWELDKTADLG
jgi:hypothetical protein